MVGLGDKASSPTEEVEPKAPWAADLESRMRQHLGTKVTLRNGEGYRGQIQIEYYNREDLDRLIELLTPREEI